jgi:hypothetical protein
VSSTKGLGVFAEALAYYDGLQKEGRISGYRVYTSTTRSHGTLIIEGELGTLAQIGTEAESLKQLALGAAVVENLNVELCMGGNADDVSQFYATTLQAVQEKGLDPA